MEAMFSINYIMEELFKQKQLLVLPADKGDEFVCLNITSETEFERGRIEGLAEGRIAGLKEAVEIALNIYTGEECVGDWPTPEMIAEAIEAKIGEGR